MATKMDEMVIGGGGRACVNPLSAKSTEQVQISMFNRTMWSRARLPLNMQERWKWVLTHYDIEHLLWKYPYNYFPGNDKQAAILGYNMQPCDPLCVQLTLEDLARLEERYLNGGGCVHASNNHLMSMLWKVGGEGNPISGSQAPLLCDATLEMHCLQVVHCTLHKANT